MTTQSGTGHGLGTLVRISVTSQGQRLDLSAPPQVPVAELIPTVARLLNRLSAESIHTGFKLVRTDGEPLDPARSLQAQGVDDGDLLTLDLGADQTAPRVYDDIVETVADTVESRFSPWSPTDSARMTLGTAVMFLVLAGVLLTWARDEMPLAPVIAAGAGVLLLTVATLTGRQQNRSLDTTALLVAGSFYLGLCGLLTGLMIAGNGPLFGTPAALAGSGLIVGGLASIAVPSDNRWTGVFPAATGIILGLCGGMVELFSLAPAAVLSLALAVVISLAGIMPWLALSTTKLRVITPLSDLEIYEDVPPPDTDEVKAQFEQGQQLLFQLRLSIAVLAILFTPSVVATGFWGIALTTLGFIGLLLGVRQTYARRDVMTISVTSIIGLILTGVYAAISHPSHAWVVGIIAGIAAAFILGITIVAPSPRPVFGRIADGLNIVCLTGLLPLGLAASGLVGS